ncbi:ABC transporter ATP-binding protein [Putridiphycobacter roseus]|uniref:ABC transporter ATP-binding protein n=1 Tax=Putridiphycobacter roseus TaxID=2219161 RepID=A0A2W1NPC2_9FLAO|nr:ABC transporter ATP-binding protein [Putridiphycobacter roseus]PZE17482.1 ABC transporter ATP-binding protein [Putridiphycobacter roseus]
MLSLNNLTIKLGDKKQVKTAGSLPIEKGLWALVGRNGAGKSTLIQTIIGVHPLESGTIEWQQRDLTLFNSKEKARIFSVVFTKPELFGNYGVEEVVALGRLPFQNVFGQHTDRDEMLIIEAMNTMGITNLQHQKFHTLSDGEKQLVMIARAIAQDTPVIILDEPTAFLDVLNRKKIVHILKEIARTKNKVILYSTHDVDMIPDTCDGMLWIHEAVLQMSIGNTAIRNTLNNLFN